MTIAADTGEWELLSEGVARRVRGLLAERRLTQADAAEALALSQQAFSRRATGRVPFQLDEIAVIARFLGVSEAALLGFAEPLGATRDSGDRQLTQWLNRTPDLDEEPGERWADVLPFRRRRAHRISVFGRSAS